MAWYKIYAGLGGGFGGPNYQGTFEYDSYDEAMEDACRMAREEYESYEGNYGLPNWEECRDDLIESGYDEPDDNEVNEAYEESIESWIDYYVDEASGPDDTDEY